MTRFLQHRVSLTLWIAAFGLAGAGGMMAGCAGGLPEPESEGAKLYVQFCSGEGCHGPIPPQRGGKGYWRNQYDRMLPMMKDAGWVLPDAGQDRKIREYLERNAG
jgi:hypothetical protein